MAVSALRISAGLLPLVMRKRATVEPVMARFSEASSVNPRRPTAACSPSTVTLPAIWSTTSSLTKRVSVGGGMSMTRRSKPVGSCCCCCCCCPCSGLVGPGGCCCDGSRMPPSTVLNTAGPAALSTASSLGPRPTRLLMTCTGPGSDSKKDAARSLAGAGGRMAVLMNPQSASLQPAMLGGIAGGLGAGPGTPKLLIILLAPVLVTTPDPVEFVMVPVLVPTNAPTVLLAPVLVTAPEAVESAMVPPLAPTKPPTVLLAPVLVTAPEAVESAMVPPLVPTKPPTVLLAPLLATAPEAAASAMVPVLLPAKPPTVLLAPVLVTAPEAVASVMVPALVPTNPPAKLAAATVTLPLACESVMAPLTELEATSPPAMLASPACTLPRATDEKIVPELLPTKPPA